MAAGERRPLVAANWKMHLLGGEAASYCRQLAPQVAALAAEAVLFPSFPLLPAVVAALAGSPVAVGGQDLHPDDEGAHTGDVSGPQLADAGCSWVLCGHSERRHDHGEDDAVVRRKVAAATRNGLRPILCVGETESEREAGETLSVLERQLREGLAEAPPDLVVAYEPVWAIGTGKTATPAIAQEAHAFLRRALGELRTPGWAAAVRLLYGGSVKPDNAADLIAQPDVDGFLVGGASLDVGKYVAIMRTCGAGSP